MTSAIGHSPQPRNDHQLVHAGDRGRSPNFYGRSITIDESAGTRTTLRAGSHPLRLACIGEGLPMVARKSASRSAEAICFLSSGAKEANEALDRLVERYGNCEPQQADVIVALGGDGLMLQTLHRMMNAPKPIYGMNRGSVGFLMNEFHDRGLRKRLENARLSIIHPLVMRTVDSKQARPDRAGDQRSLAAPPDLSGRETAHQRRRRGAARRAYRRRRSARDAGRLDRL